MPQRGAEGQELGQGQARSQGGEAPAAGRAGGGSPTHWSLPYSPVQTRTAVALQTWGCALAAGRVSGRVQRSRRNTGARTRGRGAHGREEECRAARVRTREVRDRGRQCGLEMWSWGSRGKSCAWCSGLLLCFRREEEGLGRPDFRQAGNLQDRSLGETLEIKMQI